MKFIVYISFIIQLLLSAMNARADTDLFIAALLPPTAQEYYKNLQQKIRENGIMMSDTLPNKLHITIRFVGKFNDTEKQQKVEVVKQALAGFPFPKSITFTPKNISGGHLVLANIESNELMELHQKIDKKLVEAGFEKAKNFRPHVTIGSLQSHKNTKEAIQKINEDIAKENIQLSVDEFKLLGSSKESGTRQYFIPEDYELLITF